MEFEGYLDALSSADPTPGGGSAATLVGALAAALCGMVARITLGSPKFGEAHAAAAAIAGEADALRNRFLELRPADEAAFRAVVDAQALPRASEAEKSARRERLQAALIGAAEAPLDAAQLATATLALAARTAELHNANLMSDVDCAVSFARASFDASVANVEVNHRYIGDVQVVARQRERLATLADAARDSESRARRLMSSRA